MNISTCLLYLLGVVLFFVGLNDNALWGELVGMFIFILAILMTWIDSKESELEHNIKEIESDGR